METPKEDTVLGAVSLGTARAILLPNGQWDVEFTGKVYPTTIPRLIATMKAKYRVYLNQLKARSKELTDASAK